MVAMPTISATYASPNMRVALWKEDNPSASFSWRVAKGSEVGIPAGYGDDSDLVIVTLHHNDGVRPDVEGWVDVESADKSPDGLNTLITKALGRALKKNGFPDDIAEMKLLMFWRERKAQVAAISPGEQLPALTAAVEKALDAVGVQDPGGRPDQDGSYEDPAEVDPAKADVTAQIDRAAAKSQASQTLAKTPATRDQIIADFSKLPEALKGGLRGVPEKHWANAHSAMRDGSVVIPFQEDLSVTQYNQVVQIISAWHGPDVPKKEETAEVDTALLWNRIRNLPKEHQEWLWKEGATKGVKFNSDETWVSPGYYQDMEALVKLAEEAF